MQGEVEVWTASPDGLGCGACRAFVAMLDVHERERASRFAFDRDRRAFVIAHAMRRMALGLALAVDPQDLRFGSGPHGQPVLTGHGGDVPAFSLTRSRGLVAFALDGRGPVGIDVETRREDIDAALLDAYIDNGTQPPQDEEGFHVQWTALEAFWKARGKGLSTAHPRIALEATQEGCFDVVLAEGRSPTGLVVMRLPAPATHVLSLACAETANVRMVALDGLAPAPRAEPQGALSSCKAGDCGVAVPPGVFSS